MYIYKLITKNHMERLAFLKSVRFWKLVIVAVLMAMQTEGVIPEGFMTALVTVVEVALGGSVVVRTIDRFSERVGQK